MDEIVLVDYDAQWPAMFAVEEARLRAALNPQLIVGIEHFGSTAIPGLAAKPIIDILIAVRSLAEAREQVIGPMRSLDYVFWAHQPKTDRMFFVKGMPPYGARRTHHVHITEPDGELWARLPFRDYLRAHADEAKRYERLKRDLALTHATDREAYTAGKSGYVAAVLAKARAEANS